MANFKKRKKDNVFGISKSAMEKAKVSSKKYKEKHGMYASIPLICRGCDCFYYGLCDMQEEVLDDFYKPDEEKQIVGDKCPLEVGAIMSRFDSWCAYFKIEIDENDNIKDSDLVDASLIRDLIDIEIQILRAENRVATTGDFMADTIVEVDRECNVHYEKVVSPELQYKMVLMEKRHKVLSLLNSTRKDKAKENNLDLNPAIQSLNVFADLNEKLKSSNIDFSDLG